MVVGQIVFSKAGRDKGKPFIIIGIDDNFIYLADGITRTIDKPKLKKIKHIQVTTTTVCLGEQITDCNLKQAINNYLNSTSKKGGL